LVSLIQLQEVPSENLLLLVGPPGSGKSTFCQQTVLHNIEMRPVIYVTTETTPSKVEDSLRQRGLGEALPHPLGFIDAFHETVGLPSVARPDTVDASSEDLTSMGIAISKQRDKMGEQSLLVFDSLTPPYLMNGSEILRFMRLTLLRVAAEGNAVLASVDEGCGKPEDLVAMMSTADSIVKIEVMDGSKTFRVMKHPTVEPTRIEVPMTWDPALSYHYDMQMITEHIAMTLGLMAGSPLRTEVGDNVNLFWPHFARWSGMLWDPKRFPTMTYELNKYGESNMEEFIRLLPWRGRLFIKFLPKNFSKVKDMKKLISFFERVGGGDGSEVMEYLDDESTTDEHYVRTHNDFHCWGFDHVGATMHLGILGGFAGVVRGFEKDRGGPDRDWNIVEFKCIGLGDPYCEMKFVPGAIDELQANLEAIDSTILERIRGRLMDHLMGFLLHGRPLWDRPGGDEIDLHGFGHIIGTDAAMASERYRMAMRLGGAMGGKEVGEHLMNAGIREDQAVKHVLRLLEHCKVGKVSLDETMRMVQNCESFMIKGEEPSCHFTTGFLNGFFAAVTNQHVKEIKCIAMGDPYCEWEFR
jgi:predicted hydrocarbon binding protein/KaiC/GvpD/RAD55 family RecA-like ATPase